MDVKLDSNITTIGCHDVSQQYNLSHNLRNRIYNSDDLYIFFFQKHIKNRFKLLDASSNLTIRIIRSNDLYIFLFQKDIKDLMTYIFLFQKDFKNRFKLLKAASNLNIGIIRSNDVNQQHNLSL